MSNDEVVADDHVGVREHRRDLVGELGERRAAGELVHRDAVDGLRAGMDRDRRLDPPVAAAGACRRARAGRTAR